MDRKKIYKDLFFKCICPITYLCLCLFSMDKPVQSDVLSTFLLFMPAGLYAVRKWRLAVISSDVSEGVLVWFILAAIVGGFIGIVYVIYKVIYAIGYMPVLVYHILKARRSEKEYRNAMKKSMEYGVPQYAEEE